MKRLTIPVEFNGKRVPFHVYIGEPHPKNHPLQHQAHWISTERGGTVPSEIMESFEKLHKISIENNVSFEELCAYALGNSAGGATGGGATGGAKPAGGAANPPKPAGKPA